MEKACCRKTNIKKKSAELTEETHTQERKSMVENKIK